MKKFIKERNPFLLISFIISIVVFIFCIQQVSSISNGIYSNLGSNEVLLGNKSVLIGSIIQFIIFLFVSLFTIIGCIYKKNEYILLTAGLLVVLIFMCYQARGFFIPIIWCLINCLSLIKKTN